MRGRMPKAKTAPSHCCARSFSDAPCRPSSRGRQHQELLELRRMQLLVLSSTAREQVAGCPAMARDAPVERSGTAGRNVVSTVRRGMASTRCSVASASAMLSGQDRLSASIATTLPGCTSCSGKTPRREQSWQPVNGWFGRLFRNFWQHVRIHVSFMCVFNRSCRKVRL